MRSKFRVHDVVGDWLAQGPESGEGVLAELAVFDGKDAGEGEHAGPARDVVLGFGAGFGEPAPEDAVAVGVELGFGGIKGAAEVELAGSGGVEGEGFGVEVADLPEGLTLGGVDEDVAVGEREEVGALPHFAGVDGIGGGGAGGREVAFGEGVEVLPLGEVGAAVGEFGGAVEEDHAALASDPGANEEVLGSGVGEGGGVAEAGDLHAGGGWG